MLKDPVENAGTLKGAGRVKHILSAVLIYLEKASSMLSNALYLTGTAGAGGTPVIGTLGDDTTIDLAIVPKGTASAIVMAPTVAKAVNGGAASIRELVAKVVTAIPNNTATTVMTITMPNAAHAAVIELQLLASLGAAGAIGAFEESLVAIGQIVVTRTAGVAGVAKAATLSNADKINVAGADSTATLAYSLAAVAGGVGAVNTIAIQVTIARGGGSSDNHQCVVRATIVNSNASGITLA